MKYSLVICTHNRSRQLKLCLDSIFEMFKPDFFELVVIDNNSNDSTQDVIRSYQQRANFVFKSDIEFRKGLGFARNLGWKISSGDIISFTDDDCYVDKYFAYDVLSAFEGRENQGFLGGRVMLFDESDLRITIIESSEFVFYHAGDFIPTGALIGANLSFRRSALVSAQGFKDFLGAGTLLRSGEDSEILGNLSSLGWQGQYSPCPTVFHHHGRKKQSDVISLFKGYDIGRGAYYAIMMCRRNMFLQVCRHWWAKFSLYRYRRFFNELYGFFMGLFFYFNSIVRRILF